MIDMHFHIFGQGISQSLSPTIHNAAFAALGLLHNYDIRDCTSLNDVEHLINDNDFGGASVTMPHKLSVDHHCNKTSDAAMKIGAINTLVARRNGSVARTIHGDNTDWTGLYSIAVGYPSLESSRSPVGLVIGAGGAARAAVYALAQAGIKQIYVWNRTVDKARKIAIDFRDICSVTVAVHQSDITEAPDIIIGTIPGEVLPRSVFVELFRKPKGLCIEMSYKPPVTNLLSVARTHGEWTTADGLEVLLQQAFGQSELWTGRDAPQDVMRAAVKVAIGNQSVANTGNARI